MLLQKNTRNKNVNHPHQEKTKQNKAKQIKTNKKTNKETNKEI